MLEIWPLQNRWCKLSILLVMSVMYFSCGESLPEEVAVAMRSIPEEVDYNFDVQPILSDKCFSCHGPDEASLEADLRLDQSEVALNHLSDEGLWAIEPRAPQRSLIIDRTLTQDEERRMPPPEANLRLTAQEKAILYRWVEQGAVYKPHWSLIAPKKSVLPTVSHDEWPASEIDYFVLEQLERNGMEPSPEAEKEVLIRRLFLDLIGLPPSLSEQKAFLADDGDSAYESLVDKLLSSPRFGERWAWEWLDAARYADTNGFQGDPERKMWPWRDWVIKALNENMPFDQFSIEQIAGDLIPDATTDQILATAFNRNHMYNGEGGRIPEETRVENVLDRTETVGTVWMGMTLNCCRCHDHKFDPISQEDYYKFSYYFNQTSEEGLGRSGMIEPVLDLSPPRDREKVTGMAKFVDGAAEELNTYELSFFPRQEGSPASASPAASALNGDNLYALQYHPRDRSSYHLGLLKQAFREKDEDYVKLLDRLIGQMRKKNRAAAKNLQVMVMDELEIPRPTFVLERGGYDKRGKEVFAGIPAVLSEEGSSLDDRLDLAQWLMADDHPLTARVTVNRFWQAFFGRGLVKTPEDFGVQGAKPSHPTLLDWIANDFVAHGWDVKRLFKQFVMSATYRQRSQTSAELLGKDPENILLARAPRYRLPSWMLRDQALKVSGLLSDSIGGPAVKPYQPNGIWEEATFGFKTYVQDHGEDLYRRTLYVFWRRIVGPTMLFDNSSRQVCAVKPVRTNTPLHALVSLNDITYLEAARVLAARLLTSATSDDARIQQLYGMVLARSADEDEQIILRERLEKLRDFYSHDVDKARQLTSIGEYPVDEKVDVVEHAAYAALCSIVLNLDEAVSRQ